MFCGYDRDVQGGSGTAPASDLSHFFFSMLVHRLTDEVIHNSSWIIMFADDICDLD